MTSYRDLVEAASRWIDRIAATILAGRDALHERPQMRLVEQQDGTFALQRACEGAFLEASGPPVHIRGGRVDPAIAVSLAERLRGARVELVLQPKRFMFRPLELPRRASEFLEGIVRAQIDRLTPWSAADAVFGWRASNETAGDRIEVTIAATARTLIAPFISAITALGADTVAVFAAPPPQAPRTAAIRICEQKAGLAADLPKVRRILVGLLAGGGALASVSMAANAIVGGAIEARRGDVMERIEERRATLQAGRGGTSEAARELERQKHEIPSSVIAVEALSRVLPDDTYLTELRILGDKMQIIGLTRDAPALIRLIEQTSHFSRATFFAPTTRSAGESREHFHIEAHIEPVFTPGL